MSKSKKTTKSYTLGELAALPMEERFQLIYEDAKDSIEEAVDNLRLKQDKRNRSFIPPDDDHAVVRVAWALAWNIDSLASDKKRKDKKKYQKLATWGDLLSFFAVPRSTKRDDGPTPNYYSFLEELILSTYCERNYFFFPPMPTAGLVIETALSEYCDKIYLDHEDASFMYKRISERELPSMTKKIHRFSKKMGFDPERIARLGLKKFFEKFWSFEAINRFEATNTIQSYAITCATNLLIDEGRKLERATEHGTNIVANRRRHSGQIKSADEILSAEEYWRLLDGFILENLGFPYAGYEKDGAKIVDAPKWLQAFLHEQIDEMSNDEISEVMGTSRSTTNGNRKTGRKKFAVYIQENGYYVSIWMNE